MTVKHRPTAFINGDFRLLDARDGRASAVLIENGRFSAVGSTEAITEKARALSITPQDLGGRTAIPGFVDAHTHLELSVCSEVFWPKVHCPPHTSLAAMKAAITEELSNAHFDGWMVVRSSFRYQDKVEEQRLLNRQELDELSDRPLAVAAGLHVQTLNTPALKALGLWDAESSEVQVIHRDEHGYPTGVVTEVWSDYPGFTRDQLTEALHREVPGLLTRNGVTFAASIAYHSFDDEILSEAIDAGLPLRHRGYWHLPRVASIEEGLESGIVSTHSVGTSGAGGLKIFVDGQHGDGEDAVFDDFKWTQSELNIFLERATQNGIQVMMHALSPGALRMAVQAIEHCNTDAPNPLRHRIEHGGDYLDVRDIPQIRKSGAILVTTPQFITSAGNSKEISPLRTIIDSGIPLVAGTDTTGTVPEGAAPLYNIACAIHRGHPSQHPDQRQAISFREAVRLFTTDAAFSLFEDQDRGQIAEGYWADLVVLDKCVDSLVGSHEFFELKVDLTVLEGNLVFEGANADQ